MADRLERRSGSETSTVVSDRPFTTSESGCWIDPSFEQLPEWIWTGWASGAGFASSICTLVLPSTGVSVAVPDWPELLRAVIWIVRAWGLVVAGAGVDDPDDGSQQ